jgi:hypothetical protein
MLLRTKLVPILHGGHQPIKVDPRFATSEDYYFGTDSPLPAKPWHELAPPQYLPQQQSHVPPQSSHTRDTPLGANLAFFRPQRILRADNPPKLRLCCQVQHLRINQLYYL